MSDVFADAIRRETADAELNGLLAAMQQPVTIADPLFGTLTYDRRIEWFVARAAWCGTEVRVTVAGNPPMETAAALAVGKSLWAAAKEWNDRVRDCAVRSLLDVKNGSWTDENDSAVTPAEFQQRMTLESITFNADGSFDFWHQDGDMFWGHAILVGGSLDEGPTHASISG